ncbi:DUF488 family protein [Caldicellulosiruptor changbaiensis]|uniref:DUF488 family protein n=1 Tax=Caldicellulosiruptor changbaiensis TaxID=1222016 RepID=UPI001F498AC2|nr:DUF488 family protein [Caldicellulosiruptor changbaiensis]
MENCKILELVDVRTNSFSRFVPKFRKNLENTLAQANIGYIFLRDLRGGKPEKSFFLYIPRVTRITSQ